MTHMDEWAIALQVYADFIATTGEEKSSAISTKQEVASNSLVEWFSQHQDSHTSQSPSELMTELRAISSKSTVEVAH